MSRSRNKTVKKKRHYQKKRTRKHKAVVVPNVTPKVNTRLKFKIRKLGTKKLPRAPDSYSPNVNQVISTLKSISPKSDIFSSCKLNQIKVASGGRRGKKCVNMKSRLGQTYLVDNLLSNRPINCKSITAPKQQLANCWFNAFFMSFFISDKGRKFFRYFRLAMITGKLPSGKLIPSELRMPFLLLNKYIEASIQGTKDPSDFALLMDTNNIIRKIARAVKLRPLPEGIVKVDVAGNPIDFYIDIMSYLKDMSIPMLMVINKSFGEVKDRIAHYRTGFPDILVVERENDRIGSVYIPKRITVTSRGEKLVYKLDSAILRDIEGDHFSAYITCNKKPFAFDGESFSRMTSFNWFNKLNKDTRWRFARQHNMYFNFRRGYYILLYYRT